jgi:protein SCO1/2
MIVRRRLGAAALVLAVVAAAGPAVAHSLAEVEGELGGKERYFQPVDKPAPDFALRDTAWRETHLADLRGQVVVLHFVYTSCPDVCPLHAEKIAEIQAMVNRTPMKEQVRFVTVTTDPVRDTPQILQDYGPAHGLDPVNWTFLTTLPDQPEDTTRQLAKAFGHTFTPGEDGMQMHGVVTHVIDQEGRWRANLHGLEFEPANLLVYLNALVNRAQAPHPHPEPSLWERLRGLFGA